MKKVLIIAVCGISYEGITSVIRNYCSHMDRSRLQLEFLSPQSVAPALLEEFEKMGPVHCLPDRREALPRYLSALRQLLRENRYDVVHIHGNSGTMIFEVLTARLCGVKKILVHGHNTACDHPFVNRLLTPVMKLFASRCLSCSQGAGQWLYGKSPFTVLNNAIDGERFRFDPDLRQKYRRELGLEGCRVLGHIGHFTDVKNHDFLIDVFNEARKQDPSLRLLLVSDGPNYDRIRSKVRELDLEDRVLFLGRRSDTAALYQAMDLFLLPSLWEGLPLVMLEAQAAGLPLLVSDRITEDAVCTPHVVRKALEDGPVSWAQALTFAPEQDRPALSREGLEALEAHGFDIRREARRLEEIYGE